MVFLQNRHGLLPLFEFFVRNFQRNGIVRDVDGNHIAVLYISDVPAADGFRRNVTDGSPTGCTGESAVCDEGNVLIQSHTGNGRSRGEHFPHTRAASRAFIPDNNHIALLDTAAADDSNRFFFAVEYLCRTSVLHHFRCNCTPLYNATVWSKVALEDSNTASRAIRVVNRTDDIRILVDAALNIFAQCLTSNGHGVGVDEVLLCQFVQNCINAASCIEVFHVSVASRSKMT